MERMDLDDLHDDIADEDLLLALEAPSNHGSFSSSSAVSSSVLPPSALLPTAPSRPQTAAQTTKTNTYLRQTNLWGETIPDLQDEVASSARPYRNENGQEATHHTLDFDALQTWVYPMNLGAIREYQYTIVKNSLFHNTLVALPTGLGKTFIAATVMLNFYRWTKDAKIVFVAPTKPLAAQQIDACFKIVGIPRSDTTLLTGEVNPALRAQEWTHKRVFFMTPQTLQNDLSHGYADPKSIVLLVIDEAHRSTGEYAYAKVAKLLYRFSKSVRILALTATPGSKVETVQEVIDNLGISHVEIRTEESLDIRQYVHDRNIEQEVVDFSDEIEEVRTLFTKALQPMMDKLSQQNIFWGRDTMAISNFRLLQLQKEWFAREGRHANQGVQNMLRAVFGLLTSVAHAIKLLNFHGIKPFYDAMVEFRDEVERKGEKGPKYRRQLVNDKSFVDMMRQMEQWLRNDDFLGHPKIAVLKERILNHFMDHESTGGDSTTETKVIVFSEYRDSAEHIVKILNRHQPMLRSCVFVGQADSKRSEGMKQAQQIQTIEDFRTGKYNVLVATSIGEEGLDIGQVDLIICYDASASPIRMLQRMGRTGRKRAGHIILLLVRGKEEEQYARSKDNYSAMQKLICEGSRFSFRHDLSHRIVPRNIIPHVDRKVIDIPVENTQNPDLPEPKRSRKKASTAKKGSIASSISASLSGPPIVVSADGKVTKLKKPPKKFHMPDGVVTSFLKASSLDEEGQPPPLPSANVDVDDVSATTSSLVTSAVASLSTPTSLSLISSPAKLSMSSPSSQQSTQERTPLKMSATAMAEREYRLQRQRLELTMLQAVPTLESVLLTPAEKVEFHSLYKSRPNDHSATGVDEIQELDLTAHPKAQRTLHQTKYVGHGSQTRKVVSMLSQFATLRDEEKRKSKQPQRTARPKVDSSHYLQLSVHPFVKEESARKRSSYSQSNGTLPLPAQSIGHFSPSPAAPGSSSRPSVKAPPSSPPVPQLLQALSTPGNNQLPPTGFVASEEIDLAMFDDDDFATDMSMFMPSSTKKTPRTGDGTEVSLFSHKSLPLSHPAVSTAMSTAMNNTTSASLSTTTSHPAATTGVSIADGRTVFDLDSSDSDSNGIYTATAATTAHAAHTTATGPIATKAHVEFPEEERALFDDDFSDDFDLEMDLMPPPVSKPTQANQKQNYTTPIRSRVQPSRRIDDESPSGPGIPSPPVFTRSAPSPILPLNPSPIVIKAQVRKKRTTKAAPKAPVPKATKASKASSKSRTKKAQTYEDDEENSVCIPWLEQDADETDGDGEEDDDDDENPAQIRRRQEYQSFGSQEVGDYCEATSDMIAGDSEDDEVDSDLEAFIDDRNASQLPLTQFSSDVDVFFDEDDDNDDASSPVHAKSRKKAKRSPAAADDQNKPKRLISKQQRKDKLAAAITAHMTEEERLRQTLFSSSQPDVVLLDSSPFAANRGPGRGSGSGSGGDGDGVGVHGSSHIVNHLDDSSTLDSSPLDRKRKKEVADLASTPARAQTTRRRRTAASAYAVLDSDDLE